MSPEESETTTSDLNDELKSEDEITQNPPRPKIAFRDILVAEIKRLVTISKHYQAKITASKTEVKKKYYLKKLGKNNAVLADMLVRLEHFNEKGKDSKDGSE